MNEIIIATLNYGLQEGLTKEKDRSPDKTASLVTMKERIRKSSLITVEFSARS